MEPMLVLYVLLILEIHVKKMELHPVLNFYRLMLVIIVYQQWKQFRPWFEL
jgi:hypothetical protein